MKKLATKWILVWGINNQNTLNFKLQLILLDLLHLHFLHTNLLTQKLSWKYIYVIFSWKLTFTKDSRNLLFFQNAHLRNAVSKNVHLVLSKVIKVTLLKTLYCLFLSLWVAKVNVPRILSVALKIFAEQNKLSLASLLAWAIFYLNCQQRFHASIDKTYSIKFTIFRYIIFTYIICYVCICTKSGHKLKINQGFQQGKNRDEARWSTIFLF